MARRPRFVAGRNELAPTNFLSRCGLDRAGDLFSAVPDRGDLFSVRDIRRGVRSQYQEVSQLAGGKNSSIGQPDEGGSSACSALQRLNRRETAVHHELQFSMFSKTWNALGLRSRVGSKRNFNCSSRSW
jgi:hypothetical protein